MRISLEVPKYNVYLGTYFPSAASILVAPLYGTRMFPLMAHQEKLHFVVATNGQVNRFDGEPDQLYFEDIQNHMARTFSGWDTRRDADDYLQTDSPNLAKDFRRKFPFASERFDQQCFSRKEFDQESRISRGHVKYWNSPADAQGVTKLGSLGVSQTSRQARSDPRRSEEELRLAQVSFYLKVIHT